MDEEEPGLPEASDLNKLVQKASAEGFLQQYIRWGEMLNGLEAQYGLDPGHRAQYPKFIQHITLSRLQDENPYCRRPSPRNLSPSEAHLGRKRPRTSSGASAPSLLIAPTSHAASLTAWSDSHERSQSLTALTTKAEGTHDKEFCAQTDGHLGHLNVPELQPVQGPKVSSASDYGPKWASLLSPKGRHVVLHFEGRTERSWVSTETLKLLGLEAKPCGKAVRDEYNGVTLHSVGMVSIGWYPDGCHKKLTSDFFVAEGEDRPDLLAGNDVLPQIERLREKGKSWFEILPAIVAGADKVNMETGRKEGTADSTKFREQKAHSFCSPANTFSMPSHTLSGTACFFLGSAATAALIYALNRTSLFT